MTQEGLKKMQAELAELRSEGRRKAAQRIQEAKALGDVRESGEYEDAKEYQAFIEGRIRELERLLADVQIIQETNGGGEVRLGSRVRVRDSEGYEDAYTLVGSAEADPRHGKISNESPVGQALIGRRIHDTIEVQAPAGVTRWTIVEIA